MADTIQLRGGFETRDPRLDRLPEFDERSREYGIRSLVKPTFTAGKVWTLAYLLDQRPTSGYDGSGCTNFAMAHNRLSSPRPRKVADSRVAGIEAFARERYGRSKVLDQWPGEAYEGTSVLAACKAWKERGLLGEYRWAFGIDDLLAAIVHVGPAEIGSDWTDAMMEPGPGGLIVPEGSIAGGHAYNANGVILRPERSSRWKATGVRNEPLIVGPQSWGQHRGPREGRVADGSSNWGNDGWWAMKASDVEKLLKGIEQMGEAAIPLDRAA